MRNHSTICQSSCLSLLIRLSIISLIYICSQMFCTWVLFLSLGDTKGRDDVSDVMFRFYRWRWRWCFRSKEEEWIQSQQEQYYVLIYFERKYPDTSEKKMKPLSYFCFYMSEHLVKVGTTVHVQDCDSLNKGLYLNHWLHTFVMLLTNGTLQVRSSVSLALPPFPVEIICL
jgi:hypothetical protein